MTWVMLNLVLIRLETVLVSVQDRCTVCAKHTIGSEIILDAPDSTPRGRGSSGSSFSVRLDIVRIMTQDRCTFWTQTMVLLGDGVMCNLVSVHLETVLVSVQDRCIVCAKRTIGSEIILDTPDGTPR